MLEGVCVNTVVPNLFVTGDWSMLYNFTAVCDHSMMVLLLRHCCASVIKENTCLILYSSTLS